MVESFVTSAGFPHTSQVHCNRQYVTARGCEIAENIKLCKTEDALAARHPKEQSLRNHLTDFEVHV